MMISQAAIAVKRKKFPKLLKCFLTLTACPKKHKDI